MIKLDRADTPAAAEHATVYLAFELSKAKWKLGVLLPDSQKLSRYTISESTPLVLAICSAIGMACALDAAGKISIMLSARRKIN